MEVQFPDPFQELLGHFSENDGEDWRDGEDEERETNEDQPRSA
jgi:hypothetical protein